jgi:hypothetical protein
MEVVIVVGIPEESINTRSKGARIFQALRASAYLTCELT